MYRFVLKNFSFAFSPYTPYFFYHLNATFEPGLNFIVGRNGIGKSTLFHLMQGNNLLGVQEGSMVLYDKEEKISHEHLIRTIEQNTQEMLIDELSVQRNMQCALLPRYPGLRLLASHLSYQTLLTIDNHIPVQQLSGGQRQMLAILMALQKPVRILLLDEPTSALDDENAYMVMNFLQSLADQLHLIIIIISHDMPLIKQYAQKVYALSYHENTRTLQEIERKNL